MVALLQHALTSAAIAVASLIQIYFEFAMSWCCMKVVSVLPMTCTKLEEAACTMVLNLITTHRGPQALPAL
jgi:hypothetical protein